MVNGVNLFTGSHHQCQTVILKRLKSVKEFLLFFVKMKTLDYTGVPKQLGAPDESDAPFL